MLMNKRRLGQQTAPFLCWPDPELSTCLIVERCPHSRGIGITCRLQLSQLPSSALFLEVSLHSLFRMNHIAMECSKSIALSESTCRLMCIRFIMVQLPVDASSSSLSTVTF